MASLQLMTIFVAVLRQDYVSLRQDHVRYDNDVAIDEGDMAVLRQDYVSYDNDVAIDRMV